MKKKGFTLIELLAVIVILAIIALIATPLVLNTIDKAKKGAAEASALAYMNAVERYVVESMIDTTMPQLQAGVEYQLSSTNYEVASLADPNTVFINDLIQIKGDKPESGYLIINNQGTVEEMEMIMTEYPVVCANKDCEVVDDTEEEGKYESYNVGDAVTIDGIGYHVIKSSNSNNEYVTLLKDESIGAMAFDDDSTDYETSTLKTYLNSTYKDTFGDKESSIKEITLIEMGITISETGEYLLTGGEGTYAYILNNLENSSWLTNVNFYTKTVYSNGFGSENEYVYVGSDMYEGKVRAMFANCSGTYKSGGINSNAGSGEETTGIDVRPVIVVSKDIIKAVEYKTYNVADAVTIDGVGYHVIKSSNSNNEYVTLLRDESIGTMAFDDDSTDYETSTLKTYLNSTYKDTFGDKKSLIKKITLIDFGTVTYIDDFTFTLDGVEGTYAYLYNNLNDKSWLNNNSFYTKTVSNKPQTCESVVENNGIRECVNPTYTHLYIQVTDNTVYSANYLGTVISGGSAGTTEPSTEPQINVRPVITISKEAIN